MTIPGENQDLTKRVSELMERVSRSDEEISELETKLDMERLNGGRVTQEDLVAACQSDKVAASRFIDTFCYFINFHLSIYLLTYMGVFDLGQTRVACSDEFSNNCIFVSPYYYYQRGRFLFLTLLEM